MARARSTRTTSAGDAARDGARNTTVEEVLRRNEELLRFGARLELCEEWENAARVYEMYVRDTAKIPSTGDDVMKLLYGENLYNTPIRTYREAVEYATVAACAVRMMQLVLNYYTTPDWNDNCLPSSVDLAAHDFFRWLSAHGRPSSRDCESILGMTALLEKNQKIKIQVSPSVDNRSLDRVIADVASGSTRYADKRLY